MHTAVITGMGVVSPIGHDVASFAESLFATRHGIAPIDHFDIGDVGMRVVARVRDLDLTEHFAARDLRRLDLYSVFGLIAAREAVQQAGLVGSVDPFRLATYVTSGLGGLGTFLEEQENLVTRGARRVSPMLIPKQIINMLAGLIAIETGAKGAAMAHTAACASSAVSIGEAVRLIQHGYADAVICGGSEVGTQKLVMAGFENLRAMTTATDPDHASIPFDLARGGFVMGEGAGVVVVENAEHARARGATSLAEVAGYAITTDASHITAPAEDGVAIDRAITDALQQAGPHDGRVYVNAHGTGTPMNDELEVAAIARCLGDSAVVSSTKSMTGHMLGAAGAVEVIASVLALNSGRLPATAGTVDLHNDTPIDIVTGSARDERVDRALSLSLGFGGHNVAVVLDRVPG
ncbi:MAG: beta-ketoacyl-[acyl-carrier-protein] synthase family protein [Actinomycetales bacterium]